MRPRWSYACAKALGEFLALAYAAEEGLPVVIGRLFNTSGPRQSGLFGMVLPSFVEQALGGRRVTVFGSGDQSRCFVHVKDVTEAIFALMSTPGTYGQVFNIGSTEETSVLELAERVIRLSASESEILLVPYHEAYPPGFEDMSRRVPSLERIAEAIGWAPRYSLEYIIGDVIADQRPIR